MTSIEEHKKKIKEHLKHIERDIDEGAESNPVSIGFHCSACAIQFLEMYLHILNKIPLGMIIKHNWFKRPTAEQKIEPLIERKLKVQFESKENIYNLIYKLEENRNMLSYGKPAEGQVESVLEIFADLKEKFIKLLGEQNVEI